MDSDFIYKSYIKYQKQINEDQTIWRYMNFEKFMSFLISQELWFSKIDKFVDKKEGYYIFENYPSFCYLDYSNEDDYFRYESEKVNCEDSIEAPEIITRKIEDIKKNISRVYVNSWNMSDIDSEVMWLAYGGNKNCVSIRTKLKSLVDVLSDNGEYWYEIRKVKYITHEDHAFDIEDKVEPAFCKRKRFSEESELRAIAVKYGDLDLDDFDFKVVYDESGKVPLDGLNIKINTKKLNYDVFVSPYADQWFLDLIKKIGKQYSFEVFYEI